MTEDIVESVLCENGHSVNCIRCQKCVCKRAFYQLRIVLISRFHGLIDPFIIIYQRGVRVRWLLGETQGPALGPGEGCADRLAKATPAWANLFPRPRFVRSVTLSRTAGWRGGSHPQLFEGNVLRGPRSKAIPGPWVCLLSSWRAARRAPGFVRCVFGGG